MRVFKDNDNVKDRIAKEIYNIETGMLYYDFPSEERIVKPSLYPCIVNDGIQTTIRASMGFIYLPNDVNMAEFITGVQTYLTDYDEQYKHLSRHARLDRPSGHFTAMKAKNTMTRSVQITPQNGGDIHLKRCFHINTVQTIIGNVLNSSRFYWFVFPMSVLIKNIEQFENPRFPATTQFVSIMYDKANHIDATDGEKLKSNITFPHFRVCKNLVSFKPLQRIVEKEIAKPPKTEDELDMTDDEKQAFIDAIQCPKCRKKYKSKGGLTRHTNQNKCTLYVPPVVVTNGTTPAEVTTVTPPSQIKYPCPHCKKEYRTTGSLKTHLHKCKAATAATMSLAKADVQKDNMERFLSMSAEEKKKHLEKMGGYPEYMPQWNDVACDPNHSLALCPKRGGVFELIRYFGKWDIYKDSFDMDSIPLKPIPTVIYNENFHNIIIDPSTCQYKMPRTRKKLFPKTAGYGNSEICTVCYTPLYDDIYIITEESNAVEGYAVCPTCMHFDPTPHVSDEQTVLRVSYPTSVVDIISKTDFIPLKKNIMKRAFEKNFINKHAYNTAIYIGYDPTTPQPYSYIGWSGNVSDLINYMNASNSYSESGDAKTLGEWSEKARIFPVRIIC
jgi:hypothetical protein